MGFLSHIWWLDGFSSQSQVAVGSITYDLDDLGPLWSLYPCPPASPMHTGLSDWTPTLSPGNHTWPSVPVWALNTFPLSLPTKHSLGSPSFSPRLGSPRVHHTLPLPLPLVSFVV